MADPITVYKDTRSIQIDPSAYDEAKGKGWSMTRPQIGGGAGREFASGMGVVSSQEGKDFFRHPMKTGQGMLESQGELGKRAWGELGKGDIKGGLTHGLEYLMPFIGPQLARQGDMLESGNIKGGLANMAGMATTMGLGDLMGGMAKPTPKTGFAAVSEAAAKEGINLDKVKGGTHSEALQQLENFRKTVRAKPTAKQMDVARVAHQELGKRVDAEWNSVFQKMGSKPTDADAVGNALKELSKVDPETEAWIKSHIEPSKSGQSVTAPLFAEAQKFQSQLLRRKANPNLNQVIRNEIDPAIKGLKQATQEAADKAGAGKEYARAQQMTRNFENIKYHTAYNAQVIKPSPMYGIGGAGIGLALGGKLGGSEGLGGAFLGKMVGTEIGKRVTPKGTFEIPKTSIEGERFMWKKLGEEPPKGALRKKVKPSMVQESGG